MKNTSFLHTVETKQSDHLIGGDSKHKAYLFNEDSFIIFYQYDLIRYVVHPSGLEYKEFSGTFNPDVNIFYPKDIVYYDIKSYNNYEREEIFFESITENEIVIRMELWCSVEINTR